ncbi:MAG: EAL domain-containing protein [Gammaproteobacteria bacterium]
MRVPGATCRRNFRHLRAAGALALDLTLDDFGVGYLSRFRLKWLPIGQLKFGRSFIADIGCDQLDGVICQTAIAISRHRQLRTISRGPNRRCRMPRPPRHQA